jgi:hypothetical protein
MTYQNDFTLPLEIVEQIAENGLDELFTFIGDKKSKSTSTPK